MNFSSMINTCSPIFYNIFIVIKQLSLNEVYLAHHKEIIFDESSAYFRYFTIVISIYFKFDFQ
jgi:hypothetical protein